MKQTNCYEWSDLLLFIEIITPPPPWNNVGLQPWYGMVWYGMVWYGMVWYGMVWYGMVWYAGRGKGNFNKVTW
jgi:hypothetical protein